MRKSVRPLLLSALALLLAAAAFAGEGHKCSASSADAQRFGAAIKVKKCTPVAQLAKDPARMAGRKIKIEGVVKAVCQGRGCWFEVEAADGATFMARSLDESVLVPKDCKGRTVVVQGVVKALPASAREEAEKAAHAETPHECPKPEWVLATQGVELR